MVGLAKRWSVGCDVGEEVRGFSTGRWLEVFHHGQVTAALEACMVCDPWDAPGMRCLPVQLRRHGTGGAE
jgi:hypothetical protein